MKKNTNIFEKILQISDFYGFSSINNFAINGLGYKSSEKINRLRDPTKKPSIDIIQDVSNKFVDVDLNWLISDDNTLFVETIKRNMQKKPHSNSVAKSVAESVENEMCKKSHTLIESTPNPPDHSRNEIMQLLKENKKLVEEKNKLLENENERLNNEVSKLSNQNKALAAENKELAAQNANLQSKNKELNIQLNISQAECNTLKKHAQEKVVV